MGSRSLLLLLALVGAAAVSGCKGERTTMRPSPPRALAVADVKKAFAAEGLALRAPFPAGSGMPVELIPEGAPSLLFSATVYDRSSVSKPLGLRLSNAGYVVVRVR